MSAPALEWRAGTGYDFFLSQWILHHPQRVGLRASWAAGVRARLPDEARALLAALWEAAPFPMRWVASLPPPRDVATLLAALAALPASERLPTLFVPAWAPTALRDLLATVRAEGRVRAHHEETLARLGEQSGGWKRGDWLPLLHFAAAGAAWGDALLAAMRVYQQEFFALEEARISAPLQAAEAEAQQLARTLPLPALLERLTQGVQLALPPETRTLVLAPTFWPTPLLVDDALGDGAQLLLWGARPLDLSLVPGEPVPDALLRALKAVADPTRLRILRLLREEPHSPSTLAAALRLRAPTVVHHLHALRLARLITLREGGDSERPYTLRESGLEELWAELWRFLD